jgi:hypothetical protein
MSEAIPADAPAFLGELVSRLQRGTLARLRRIPEEALYWQPHRESNSIGVTVWHYTRWWDLFGTVVLVDGMVEDQHWFRDGWMERTGYDPRGKPPDGLGLITDYSVEEMLAVPQLSAEDLAAYHTPSMNSTLSAIAAEDAASLGRILHVGESEAGGSRYAQILALALGSHRHLGEIDTLASLYERQKRSG